MSKISRRTLLQGLAGTTLLPGLAAGQETATDASPFLGPAPIRAENGQILLRAEDMIQVQGRQLVRVDVPLSDRPVLGPEQTEPAHALLRDLVAKGQAAGNHGDLYENRDRGHSRLSAEAHPQLTHIVYDDPLRKAGIDYGAAGSVLFDAPVIANSSTALTDGVFWRSLPRLLLTSTAGPRRLYQNYRAGQIHVYPEHRDHDRIHGDLIPANTPFFLISQGSSRSDRPLLEALAMILAAFRPETKDFLHRNHLLAPTVQTIFRHNFPPLRQPEIFRTGLAHPTTFHRRDINLMGMVQMAQALTPETVPPLVELRVLSENHSREGIDHFGTGLTEQLFDTPVAISRLWRSPAHTREMIVAAQATGNVPGREGPLDWRLLRGDRTRVQIEPLDPLGRRARITLQWQNRLPVPGDPRMSSNRIDIGVFARSSLLDGMPGLISILLPQHETRRYGAGPNGQMRLESRDFRHGEDVYADPILFPYTDWHDTYLYDTNGRVQGWEREHQGERLRFDAQGRYLSPTGPVAMHYAITPGPEGAPQVRMEPRQG